MPNQNTEAYQLGYRHGINNNPQASPFKTEKETLEYNAGYSAGSAVLARRKMGMSPNMR